MGEKYYTDIREISELVVDQLKDVESPIILFGHSMGTKLVYEVEQSLEALTTEPEPEKIAALPDEDGVDAIIFVYPQS